MRTILLSLLLLLLLLLVCPVQLAVRQKDGKFSCVLRILFVFRFPISGAMPAKRAKGKSRPPKTSPPAKTADMPKTDSAAAHSEADAQARTDKSPKTRKKPPKKSYLESLKPQSLSELLYLIRAGLDASGKPVRMLCKGVTIRRLKVEWIVADEDACRCAVEYGAACALLYNTLAWVNRVFRIRAKRIFLTCRYNYPTTQFALSCIVSIAPVTALCASVGLAFRFWRRTRNGLSEPAAQSA